MHVRMHVYIHNIYIYLAMCVIILRRIHYSLSMLKIIAYITPNNAKMLIFITIYGTMYMIFKLHLNKFDLSMHIQ